MSPYSFSVARRLRFAVLTTATLLIPSGFASAATTGSTSLYTPQGNTAGTGNGDYVTDTGGMNTFYRYWIEVPAGLSRLDVDLFDADIGLGGATEDTAGRDRDRGGAYNTTATYSIIDPGGTARTTRFNTGSLTLPAGSDNTWLTFYSGTGRTVADNFNTAAFTNNTGTNNWAAAWIENDSLGAGAAAGSVQVITNQLRIQDAGATGLPSLERQANLSTGGLDMGMAFLNFDLTTSGNLEDNDRLTVQVSPDGGANWTSLNTYLNDSTVSASFDISSFIATNTRIRFIVGLDGNLTGTEYFFVDNVVISDGPVTAGHWELRVAMNAGDDINGLGIRVHDGTSGAGGTELNTYFDTFNQFGINPPASGTNSRSYSVYPYITATCTSAANEFDYDSNRGNTGSLSFTSRLGTFTQNYDSTVLSADDVWSRDTFSGWTSDTDAVDYGIWSGTVGISSYLVGGTPNGNYTTFYMSNTLAAANPPATNPMANTYRVYLPTDANAAPVKPYLEQQVRWSTLGPNPPQVGQISGYTVTVRLVNPTPYSVTFSATNLVTANVPGAGVTYGGVAQVSQGTITAQPVIGGTGNITWNPGTVTAGSTELLAYQVRVTPTSAGQRLPVTATPASGNGTRAQFVDETGNTTQTRSTFLAGPLCELAVTQGLLTQAVVSSFKTRANEDGGVLVEWTTASEAGTAGFYLSRWDAATKSFVRVSESLLPGLIHADQGGTYRFVDDGASPRSSQTYLLEEVEVGGGRKSFGPFTGLPSWERPEGARAAVETFEREPHEAIRRTGAPAVPDSDGGAMRQAVAPGIRGPADSLHIAIRETGLYYLSSTVLSSKFGVTAAEMERLLPKGKLLLTRDGMPVAWYPDFVPPGNKTAKGLYFYGEAADSLYTRDAVYRLRQSNGSGGLTMLTAAGKPATAVPAGASFPAALPSEVNAFPATAISPDPESDYWYWDFLVAGDATYGHKTYSADAPGLASSGGAGSITLNLQGASDTATAGEHHAAVAVNGTAVGEMEWQTIAPRQGTFPIPAGVLLPTGNQVQVTATIGNGAPYSILYVDGFELGYPRDFAAAADGLTFTDGGSSTVTVTGFSSPAVRLLDVTDPMRPLWVTGAAVEADPGAPGTWRLSFIPTPEARYLAAGPGALKVPPAIRRWSEIDLHHSSLAADVLIVAPSGFEIPAERLAEQRRSQGLTAQVVTLTQAADSFGDGVATPQALQAFLSHAYTGWFRAPRYVVLVGEGSLDYRNLQGYGDSVMPPIMIQGEGGLFPSDNRFADIDGDSVPDMAIGRIPVVTPSELNAYVDKIVAYEASGTPAWAANALMLADYTDGGADFAADSDQLASRLPPGSVAKPVYLSTTPLAQARTELLQGIEDGAAWLNFLGHGGLDRLSSDGLLASADVAGLTNGPRLPVVTAMTCTINRFAVPGVPSLGELLAKRANGGAAAVWGPSGLSYHGEARQLAEIFYRLGSAPADQRLGDIVVRSLDEFGGLGGDSRMLDIYNLLGDPSLLVRRGPAPVAEGGGGVDVE